MTSATVPPPETRSWEDRAEMQDRSSASVGASRRPSRQSKSAFPGTMRQASAFADAGDVPRSAQADRWPEASSGRIHSTHPGAPATLRDRIVTAGMKWMATGDPFEAQPSSTEQSVASDGLIGVLGAARIKPAAGRQERRDPPLIQADQPHRRPRREILSPLHPLTSLPQRRPPRALPAKPPATPAGGAPRTAPLPHPAACAPGDPAGR